MANFHIMTKPIGPLCNLDCAYCFYLEKEKLYVADASGFRMSDDLLERYIRQYLRAQSSPSVTFSWQGGEPTLLGVEFFERVLALETKYAEGRRVENTLQTNGTLLDDRWCAFFARHNFLVGLSLDGPAELHDAYRVDKGGEPTHERVLRGLKLLQKHGVAFNTLTSVNRLNARHPLEVYRFLKEVGSQYLQFIPIVEERAPQPDASGLRLLKPGSASVELTDWSVESLAWGEFLSAIFDEWVRHDVARVFVNLFDVALEAWLGLDPSLCVFSRRCGAALALEHNGDLYSCDHYVYPENLLGNIRQRPLSELALLPQQLRFGEAKEKALPRQCRACSVRFACNGGCPKHRFLKTVDGEGGLNYLCSGLKHFFEHIDPCMSFMASELQQQRPPAGVMAWLSRDGQSVDQ